MKPVLILAVFAFIAGLGVVQAADKPKCTQCTHKTDANPFGASQLKNKKCDASPDMADCENDDDVCASLENADGMNKGCFTKTKCDGIVGKTNAAGEVNDYTLGSVKGKLTVPKDCKYTAPPADKKCGAANVQISAIVLILAALLARLV